jgi:hypothetical protein
MMKTLFAAALAAAAAAGLAKAETLAGLRWEKRVVIVFAAAGDGRLGEQRGILLQHKASLADRDLLVFAVVDDRLEPIYGKPPAGETAAELRQRFAVADGAPFVALLIGKDGGVKWQGERPIGSAELNRIIDAMPMRRNGG